MISAGLSLGDGQHGCRYRRRHKRGRGDLGSHRCIAFSARRRRRLGNSIIQYIKRKYNLLIGERTAEDIKIDIGSAFPFENEAVPEGSESGGEPPKTVKDIKGRDLMDGLPKNIQITSQEIREALADPLSLVLDAIRTTLEKTPPELSADIIDHGITLTGGGALLRGLDALIEKETGMPVHIAQTPLDCVAMGTGKVLDDIDRLRELLSNNAKELMIWPWLV